MVRKIALSAIIAAIYAVLTVALAPISYGSVQFRVAEALTLLPFCMPEAVPGLFIGCMISNVFGGFGLVDIFFGSAATLLAAWLTCKMPNIWLAAIPPIAVNTLVVGGYLGIITETPVFLSMSYIVVSQTVICFGLGVPLCELLCKSPTFRTRLFSKRDKAAGSE